MTRPVAEHVDAALRDYGRNGSIAFVGLTFGGQIPHFTFDGGSQRATALTAIEALPEPDMIILFGRESAGSGIQMAHYAIWEDGEAVPVGFISGQPAFVFQLFVQALAAFDSICAALSKPRKSAMPKPSVN